MVCLFARKHKTKVDTTQVTFKLAYKIDYIDSSKSETVLKRSCMLME